MKSEKEKKAKAAADLTLTHQILDFLCTEAADTIEILKKNIKEEDRGVKLFFCVSMVTRLHNAAEGIRVLFKEYASNHHRFDFSIGIILRSLLLDYMIMLNVLEIMGRDNISDADKLVELDDFCLCMLSDSAIHALKYFNENTDSLSGEKRKRVLASLVENHPYCFEPYANDGSIPVLKKRESYSQKKLVSRLKKSSKYKHLSRKEDWYMYYSKYDHFGGMYLTISGQHISIQFDHMCSAIRELPSSFVLMIAFLCEIFSHKDPLMEKLEKCKQIISQLEKYGI